VESGGGATLSNVRGGDVVARTRVEDGDGATVSSLGIEEGDPVAGVDGGVVDEASWTGDEEVGAVSCEGDIAAWLGSVGVAHAAAGSDAASCGGDGGGGGERPIGVRGGRGASHGTTRKTGWRGSSSSGDDGAGVGAGADLKRKGNTVSSK
jgi:hypothetical protein